MTDTSSIGPQWPPLPTSHRRVKGIDNRGVIRDITGLGRLLDDLAVLRRELAAAEATRLSVRAVVADDVLEAGADGLKPWGEALIPLGGGRRELEGHSLVYLGWNDPERASSGEDLDRALGYVDRAAKRGRRDASGILHRTEAGGYRLWVPTQAERHGGRRVLAGVAALYERFGWTADETGQILAHPSSLIALGEHGGEIVGAALVEPSRVELGDGVELRIAEFTEAATRGDHRGRGLYSALCLTLMEELHRLSSADAFLDGRLDVAFGESSGQDLGVLMAATHLGRTFSLRSPLVQRLGWKGYLPQHVPIADAPRSTPYNDLFPTFISPADLERFVAGTSGVAAAGQGSEAAI
ncbi:MAG: hypothetical protein AAGD06_28025 [Acidobacteriota bacterium]